MPDLPIPTLPNGYYEAVTTVIRKDPVAFVRAFSSTTWGPVTDAVRKDRLDRLVEVANALLDRMDATDDLAIDHRYLRIEAMDPFTLDLALDGLVTPGALLDLVISGDDLTGPHGEPVIRLAVDEFGVDGAPEFLGSVRAFDLLQEEIDDDLGKARTLSLLKRPLQKGMTGAEVDLFYRDDFEESEEQLKTKSKTHRVWTGDSIKQNREIQSLRVTLEEGKVVGWDDMRKKVKDETRPENIRAATGVWGTGHVAFQAAVSTLWMCEQGGMSEDERATVLDALLTWGREEDRFALWRLPHRGLKGLRAATQSRFLSLLNGAMIPLPVDELIDRCTDWAQQERDGILGAKTETESPPGQAEVVPAAARLPVENKGCRPCFVATACFEEEDEPLLDLLRQWRDYRVARSAGGRIFLAGYDVVGPRLAQFIAPRDRLRRTLREVLLPVGRAIVQDHLSRPLP